MTPKNTARALLVLLFLWVLLVSHPGRWVEYLFRAGVFLLALSWIGRHLTAGHQVRGSLLLLPVAGAVAWACFQLLAHTSSQPFATSAAALAWGSNLLLFFLALQVFRDREVRDWMRRSMLWFGFLIAIVAVLQMLTSEGKIFWIFQTPYRDQVLGPFVSRDHYSSLMLLVLPLAVFQALRDRRRMLLYAAIAATMFASVIAGASRAGAILVTAEIAVLLLPALAVRRHAGESHRAVLARVGALAVAFTLVVGWEVLWQRFQDPDPYRHRREMLLSSIGMVRERPWTGFGLGTYESAYPAHALFDVGRTVNHAHNDWAQWAAEGGVPFFALMLVIGVCAVPLVVRRPWAIGIVAVLLHSTVDFPMQKPALAAWVFVLLGAANRGQPACFLFRKRENTQALPG